MLWCPMELYTFYAVTWATAASVAFYDTNTYCFVHSD